MNKENGDVEQLVAIWYAAEKKIAEKSQQEVSAKHQTHKSPNDTDFQCEGFQEVGAKLSLRKFHCRVSVAKKSSLLNRNWESII